MKKIVLLCIAFLGSIVFVSANNENIGSLCDSLLSQTKKTATEKTARLVCNKALDLERENKILKKSAQKAISKEIKWSDTKISLKDVKKIQSDSILYGSPNARFLIIEYSDLQCPFCQRHRNNKTLKTIVEEYSGQVSKTFRHFPLNFHQYALSGALSAECALAQGKDNYYKFIDAVYSAGLTSNNILENAAKDLKLDIEKWNNCLGDKSIKAKIVEQMQEGQQLFGVNGTPGNVILDTITGQFKLISGAYPIKTFEEELNKVIKK